MDTKEEKRYHSVRQTTSTLFLIAYILSVAFRDEFLPLIFGYLAIALILVNLILFIRIIPMTVSGSEKKLKRKQLAGISFGVLINLIVVAMIIVTLVTWE